MGEIIAGAVFLGASTSLPRHESPDTTAHYAKIDVATLRLIAQPWPEDA